MLKIAYLLPGGEVLEIVSPSDRDSVMELGRRAGVPGIVGDCGGFMACATCHVHVAPEWRDAVGSASEEEQAMIALTADPRPDSRLGCQIWLHPGLDGLRVAVAPH
ncbi:2Fe-2S iron-sulfur cluster-binding protein [Sphingobium sufflavum]|uniref:2Fe-2S iron-sulfur cluster-binding protein n=1 Tax=Sphingobium sufflavum TaxID=1129547 RepID=UPI001F19874B|nr:2Fe-2S iron-sulfur cluster-binding protein [Sphingobium sufflavum]MCE7798478.1 2Fe-2S iron-sulfur cluster-binding protein [Sphingobium sufflavum]